MIEASTELPPLAFACPDTWLQRLGHALAPADRSEMLAWCRSLNSNATVPLIVPQNAADCEHRLRQGVRHPQTWALLEQTRQMLWRKVAVEFGALRARGHITVTLAPLKAALRHQVALLSEHDPSGSNAFASLVLREALWAAEDGALARLAQAPPDHPFRLRLNLFEAGRWPVGPLSLPQNEAPDWVIF